MLSRSFIEQYAKINGIPFRYPRRILAEYLQSEILFILYNSKYGGHFSFLGGTCLRFVHKLDRFSEDLDFDLVKKGVSYARLSEYIVKELKELGLEAEAKVKKTENIFMVQFRFSGLLKETGLSDMTGQKIMIKFEVDPSPLKKIKYETVLIESFGRQFFVTVNTLSTIFAQKILAFLLRPYQKGRDFYDLVWFLNQKGLEPEYGILKEKSIRIANKKELVAEIKKKLKKMDKKKAKEDLEPFLFYPEKAKLVLDLEKYLENFEK